MVLSGSVTVIGDLEVTMPVEDGWSGRGPLGRFQAGALLMKELLVVCGLIIFMMACGANQAMMMACFTRWIRSHAG